LPCKGNSQWAKPIKDSHRAQITRYTYLEPGHSPRRANGHALFDKVSRVRGSNPCHGKIPSVDGSTGNPICGQGQLAQRYWVPVPRQRIQRGYPPCDVSQLQAPPRSLLSDWAEWLTVCLAYTRAFWHTPGSAPATDTVYTRRCAHPRCTGCGERRSGAGRGDSGSSISSCGCSSPDDPAAGEAGPGQYRPATRPPATTEPPGRGHRVWHQMEPRFALKVPLVQHLCACRTIGTPRADGPAATHGTPALLQQHLAIDGARHA
jgi:hypothetical protein